MESQLPDCPVAGHSVKAAGFGYRKDASLASLDEALALVLKVHGDVDYLAASSGKVEVVKALGLERNLRVRLVDEAELSEIATLTQSQASLREKGTGSFAEAVALAGAGPDARLLGPRIVSKDGMATCAVAEGAGS
jgi:cobalt-precorrin 5A hydrolase